MLLDAGANAARVSSDGRTPLATAIEECHVEVARLLTEALAATDGGDEAGAAAENDTKPGVVDARADSVAGVVVEDAFCSAHGGSGVAGSAAARQHAGQPLPSKSRRQGDLGVGSGSDGRASAYQRGVLIFCDAVQAGDLRRVYELLIAGTDANGVDGDGFTALHRCAVTGNIPLCDLLLGHGADPNARDNVSISRVPPR